MSLFKTIKLTISITVLALSSSLVLAQSNNNRCLRAATNDELLNEISRRLDGGTSTPSTRSIATFSCYYSTLNIGLINAAGQESRVTTSTSSESRCNQFAETFSSNIRYVEQPTLIATCFYSTLNRFMMQPTGEIVQINSQSTSSENACLEQADQINSLQ